MNYDPEDDEHSVFLDWILAALIVLIIAGSCLFVFLETK